MTQRCGNEAIHRIHPYLGCLKPRKQIPSVTGVIPTLPTMADNALCALICLIEGNSSLFRVEPTGDMNMIMMLKKLIKEEVTNATEHVLAEDLTLWKVRKTMASDSTTNFPAG
jgi:hypothetical protein